MKDKKSRNIRTGAFGPPTWVSMTLIAMGYPESNPTKEQRKTYSIYFRLIGEVLPCNLCRTSYRKFVKKVPLNSKVLSWRRNLVFWVFKIHNLVNKNLGCRVLNRKQLESKFRYYEQFRATGCSPKIGGCIKANRKMRKPKKLKVITICDNKAVNKTK